MWRSVFVASTLQTIEPVFCDLHMEVFAGQNRGYSWTAGSITIDHHLKLL